MTTQREAPGAGVPGGRGGDLTLTDAVPTSLYAWHDRIVKVLREGTSVYGLVVVGDVMCDVGNHPVKVEDVIWHTPYPGAAEVPICTACAEHVFEPPMEDPLR